MLLLHRTFACVDSLLDAEGLKFLEVLPFRVESVRRSSGPYEALWQSSHGSRDFQMSRTTSRNAGGFAGFYTESVRGLSFTIHRNNGVTERCHETVETATQVSSTAQLVYLFSDGETRVPERVWRLFGGEFLNETRRFRWPDTSQLTDFGALSAKTPGDRRSGTARTHTRPSAVLATRVGGGCPNRSCCWSWW